MKSLLFIFSIFVSLTSITFASDHIEEAAGKGKVIVVYSGQCPGDVRDEAIIKIKELIAYEVENSPISFPSSPGIWSNGSLGAVDLHNSIASMRKVFKWQETNPKWSKIYSSIVSMCGIEDFDINILEVQ
ncbi:hypothetical protein N9S49_01585 [Rhodobiaceae bacterium]|jgi:hypothetical protein|nr:hypothetical protein [Rhodobiaceae bacterium]